jgi:hypothetical protein
MADAPAKKITFKLPSLSLPFLKKKSEPSTAPPSPTPLAELTEDTKELANKTLAELVDEKIDQLSGHEYVTIKVHKHGLLLFGGILLLAIWMTPLVRYGIDHFRDIRMPRISMPQLPFIKKPVPSPTPSMQPEATPEASPSGIRIRTNAATPSAEAVKKLLESKNIGPVEIVFDPQVDSKTVTIATHSGTIGLGPQLFDLFKPSYSLSSVSANLTDDSQFAASILLGKNAGLKK